MSSADLTRSPTWERLGTAIERQFRAGVPFADILEMNVAIKQRDLSPYRAHRARLDALLWFDDPEPKRIIEIGPGYGAMARFWPISAQVYNVDLPEMLAVQKHYVGQVDDACVIEFVPFFEADRIDVRGAYLFSAWALTETTRATWDYWIARAPELAGAYVLGHARWIDEPEPWPWGELLDAFNTQRLYDGSGEHWELAAVNR